MIIPQKQFMCTPFKDPRGRPGQSGELFIASDKKTKAQFLVKSKPGDVTNEFVSHGIGRIIGVPTSDAILIEDKGSISVGIRFLKDFERIDIRNLMDAEKYPDNTLILRDLMKHAALRDIIILDDNIQLALSQGRLISFDYADSFYVDSSSFDALIMLKMLPQRSEVFSESLKIGSTYHSVLDLINRSETTYLRNIYTNTLVRFQQADFELILADLSTAFPAAVSNYYSSCIEKAKKAVEHWLAEK